MARHAVIGLLIGCTRPVPPPAASTEPQHPSLIHVRSDGVWQGDIQLGPRDLWDQRTDLEEVLTSNRGRRFEALTVAPNVPANLAHATLDAFWMFEGTGVIIVDEPMWTVHRMRHQATPEEMSDPCTMEVVQLTSEGTSVWHAGGLSPGYLPHRDSLDATADTCVGQDVATTHVCETIHIAATESVPWSVIRSYAHQIRRAGHAVSFSVSFGEPTTSCPK